MRLTFVAGPVNVGPFELQDGPNLIGRDIICRVHLPGRQVSRQHAVVHVERGRVRIEDTGTANALLDGAGKRTSLLVMQDGDRVQVGEFVLQLEDDELELEEEERTNTRSSRRPSPPPRPQYSRNQGTFPTLLPIPPEPETETELSLDDEMEPELSLDTEHTFTHSSRPPTPPPRPNLALPRPTPKASAPAPAAPPPKAPVVPLPIAAPVPLRSIPDPVATPAPMSPPPRPPEPGVPTPPSSGPVPIAGPSGAPPPPAGASPAITPAPRPPSPIVSPPVAASAPKAALPIAAPGIMPSPRGGARPAPVSPVPESPPAAPVAQSAAPPAAAPVLRPPAKSSFPPSPLPPTPSSSAERLPATPSMSGPARAPVVDPTGEPESSGTSWTTPSPDSLRPAVARLVPRPSSRNERPKPSPSPAVRPDPHPEDEAQDSGIPWLLQMISGLALVLGLWLATPGGGSLALVNSAYEGGKKISAEHAEAVLVGLAETNAVRLRQGLEATVDPFDNMPGVQQVYVVDPNRRILVPESEKGTPLEGAERYQEKPIRFEGKTLGYIELAYDPDTLVHRSWSPLLYGLLALTVAGLGSCVMVLVGWLLLVRPWMRLASALESGGQLPSPNGFGPMDRVIGWLRRHR